MNPQPTDAIQPATETPPPGRSGMVKLGVMAVFAVMFVIGLIFAKEYLNLDFLAEQESRLKSFYRSSPVLILLIAFLIYAVVTGLSIPGATILSLVYAWFFGFGPGLTLVSFASTLGATIAFLLSRYLFRDWIQNRFGDKITTINDAFDREGNFYLFMMRLIPAFPFFMVNALMGLTKIKTATFWWVSQLGMLGGTAVIVYAGSSIPDLMTLKEKGISAIFTPGQLLQISIAFVLLGVFPFISKRIVQRLQSVPPTG